MATRNHAYTQTENYTGRPESYAALEHAPWGNLGITVEPGQSIPELLKKAKIDWTVSLRDITYTVNSAKTADGKPVRMSDLGADKFKALVRDSDDQLLDMVGSRYIPTQNAEAFEFFTEFVEAGDAHIQHLGSLRGGRMIWGLADLGTQFVLPGKDVVRNYLLLALPHEQGRSIRAKRTSMRFFCMNMLTTALSGAGAGFRQTHRAVFDKTMQALAKKTMGIAREEFEQEKVHMQKLSKARIAPDQAELALARLIEPEEDIPTLRARIGDKDYPIKTERLIDALHNSPGADAPSAKGTLWGFLNAVTYAVDHTFGKGLDQRLTKGWFGNGENLKQRALRVALDMAG